MCHFPPGVSVVTENVKCRFVTAVDLGDLNAIRQMLDKKEVTLNSWADLGLAGSASLTKLALLRLRDNLAAVKMLVDEYNVPLPEDFLQSVETRDVALYLIEEKGVNPYAEGEKEKKMRDDGKCCYFSQANIKRLADGGENNRALRPQDYRIVGENLEQLANVVITNVSDSSGYVGQAPSFRCASKKEAETLVSFLREKCNLQFYYDAIGNQVISNGGLPNVRFQHTAFIQAVGTKAGIFEEVSISEEEPASKGCCCCMQ